MRYVLGLWSVVMICSVLTAQNNVSTPASDASHADSEIERLLKVMADQQRSIDHQQEAIANQQKQIMEQRHEIEELKQQWRSNSSNKSAGNNAGSSLQTAKLTTASATHSRS